MFNLSCGESDEHSSPIWKTETKHALSSLLRSVEHPTSANFSVSLAIYIADRSTISSTLLGNAILTKLWRFRLSSNESSVGRRPVKSSNKRTPKLYTSPRVDTILPMPYSGAA